MSKVGVPQHAQDLVSYEYQLVLHSIKQDLGAVLQRQANTSVNVDWELLMDPRAPEEPKHILQGLVYVAKIKDVANTRGGAQVSQHRRVLAQQTYNMLVQELGDVLQGQAVQRRLRDLSAGTNPDLEGNRPRNQTVQSNFGLPVAKPSNWNTNNETFETSSIGESSSTGSAMHDDDTNVSVKSSSTIHSIEHEMLKIIDIRKDDKEVDADITEILEARKNDVNKTNETLQILQEQLGKPNNLSLKKDIKYAVENLRVIQSQRTEQLLRYDTSVETYKKWVNFLKQDLEELYHGIGRVTSSDDTRIGDFDAKIQETNDFYKGIIKQTKTDLDNLKRSEEDENERIQALLLQSSVDKD